MFGKLKSQLRTSNRKSLMSLAVASVLLVGGITSIAFGLAAQQNAPMPSRSAYGKLNSSGVTGTKPASQVLSYSKPVSLSIPAINVSASLITVGKNPDGSIEVPAPPYFDNPAWYKYSPTPGQYGASVIVGHVDNYYTGASVFFNLGELKPNDQIMIKRADGITAVFKVRAVRQYTKTQFPTAPVYGAEGNDSELHLITCSGTFDRQTGHYLSNIVAFATLDSARH